MSRNSKITMQIFFFFILKLLLLLFSCWTLCTLIFIISLGAHFCDTSHSSYPMVPICLFVWHVTWISFPNFFLLRICQWLESEAVVLLGCCGFRVSTTSCSRVTLQYLGQKGSPGTCCSGLGWEGGGECWCKGSSGMHWGPACHMFAVESAKHRNCFKTTFIQSHSPLILCFVLEGDSERESLCALKFKGC